MLEHTIPFGILSHLVTLPKEDSILGVYFLEYELVDSNTAKLFACDYIRLFESAILLFFFQLIR